MESNDLLVPSWSRPLEIWVEDRLIRRVNNELLAFRPLTSQRDWIGDWKNRKTLEEITSVSWLDVCFTFRGDYSHAFYTPCEKKWVTLLQRRSSLTIGDRKPRLLAGPAHVTLFDVFIRFCGRIAIVRWLDDLSFNDTTEAFDRTVNCVISNNRW